jgi:hypothetical protein
LTWPGGQRLITKIKASITAGIRPLSMLFHEQPGDPWTPYDFKLLEAYQILQDETCPSCGHPVWLCRNPDPRVSWKVRDTTCYATKAQEEINDSKKPRKEQASKEDKKKWGVSTYTVPYVPPNLKDAELPTRSDYYRDLQA